MKTSVNKSGAVTIAAAAALLVGLASPAQAESIGLKDPADTGHGSDLRSVEVRNNQDALVVVTTHTDLRRDPATGSGGAVFIDTDPTDSGPEYVLVGGFFVGTDYSLLETEGFANRKWGQPVDGSYVMRVNYDKDRVRIRIAQDALDDRAELRVAVRVSGTRRDGSSTGLVDWLGEPRSFTPWVARG